MIIQFSLIENLRPRMGKYLERLLPTLYIIRHELDKDINKLIDDSEILLTKKHIRKLSGGPSGARTQDLGIKSAWTSFLNLLAYLCER